jgi:choline dehydrogenase-like flavoprotein
VQAALRIAREHETVRNGKRQLIFRSYVYPLMAQPNLTVLTGALAMRILFDHRRATGIGYRYQGKTVLAEATRGLGTFWHQSSTAKMGRDEMSVADGQLKVYGVERLRIADASILPRVTTGNTMAPCVVIGGQAAAFLQRREEYSNGRAGDTEQTAESFVEAKHL